MGSEVIGSVSAGVAHVRLSRVPLWISVVDACVVTVVGRHIFISLLNMLRFGASAQVAGCDKLETEQLGHLESWDRLSGQ